VTLSLRSCSLQILFRQGCSFYSTYCKIQKEVVFFNEKAIKVKWQEKSNSNAHGKFKCLIFEIFLLCVETGVPGGKPLKRKFLFLFVICVFSTSFLWVETGVPGVKPPSQIPASRGRCLGFESDGQLFVHLADWALNTSSPEGLKAVRQRLSKTRKLLSLPTRSRLGPSRSSPEGAMARKGDKWRRNMCFCD